jgi:hypothetical protein
MSAAVSLFRMLPIVVDSWFVRIHATAVMRKLASENNSEPIFGFLKFLILDFFKPMIFQKFLYRAVNSAQPFLSDFFGIRHRIPMHFMSW